MENFAATFKRGIEAEAIRFDRKISHLEFLDVSSLADKVKILVDQLCNG
jgi:hypothetical protein